MEIKNSKTYARNGILYIDTNVESVGRLRFSTKLEDSKLNRAKVLLDIDKYIYKYLRADENLELKNKLTFKALYDDLFKNHSLKHQSIKSYQSMFNSCDAYFHNKDVRMIPIKSYEAFFATKPKKYLAFINRLLKVAQNNGNDVALLNEKHFSFKESKKVPIIPFNLKEMREILKADISLELKTFLAIGFLSGARTGEILALNVSDINFKDKCININKSMQSMVKSITTPKTKSSLRQIDILPLLENYLSTYISTKNLSPSDNLFSKNIRTLRAEFNTLLDSMGLPRRRIYQTRHSFASIMLSEGEEPMWVSYMLGHKDLNITLSVYAKYIKSDKQRAVFLNNFDMEGDNE